MRHPVSVVALCIASLFAGAALQKYYDARRYAAVLQSRGVGPGAHVAILGPTTRSLVTAIEAVWLAGATTVVLPLPMRLASLVCLAIHPGLATEQTRKHLGARMQT